MFVLIQEQWKAKKQIYVENDVVKYTIYNHHSNSHVKSECETGKTGG